MMAFGFNDSMVPYAVLEGLTNNFTGSWELTFALVVILLIIMLLALRVPIEFSVIIVVPLTIVFMAFSPGHFVSFGTFLIAYLGFILAKNFIF
jgi:hypothetical protein